MDESDWEYSRDNLMAEIERLRTANTFAAEILSRWLAHQYSHQEQYRVLREARDKLRGVNEQKTLETNFWLCTNCGLKHPISMMVCPNDDGDR